MSCERSHSPLCNWEGGSAVCVALMLNFINETCPGNRSNKSLCLHFHLFHGRVWRFTNNCLAQRQPVLFQSAVGFFFSPPFVLNNSESSLISAAE